MIGVGGLIRSAGRETGRRLINRAGNLFGIIGVEMDLGLRLWNIDFERALNRV